MLIISRSNGPTRAEAKKRIFSSITYNREELAFITDFSYNNKIYAKTDKIFSKGKDRVTFDVSKYDISEECPYEHDVRVALYGMNFELTDYMKGLCKHEDGRTFRVAKILKRDPNNSDLVKNFINSSVRASYKSKKVATLSRNMFDIITMSTFKGWSSCMDLDGGCNKEYVGNDIASGTLIIYLHDEKDTEIKSPICRILLRPFYHYAFGKLNLFYGSEAISYGTTNIDMENIGNDVAKFINQEIVDKRYRKMKETFIEAKIQNNVYEDDISSTIIVEFKELDFNDIEIIRNFKISNGGYSRPILVSKIENVKNKNMFIVNPEFYSYVNFTIDDSLIDILNKENDEIISSAIFHLINDATDFVQINNLFGDNKNWLDKKHSILFYKNILNDDIKKIFKDEQDFLSIVEMKWSTASKPPVILSKSQIEVIKNHPESTSITDQQRNHLMISMIKTVLEGDDSILDRCRYYIHYNLIHLKNFSMEEKAKLFIIMNFNAYGRNHLTKTILNSEKVSDSIKEIIKSKVGNITDSVKYRPYSLDSILDVMNS